MKNKKNRVFNFIMLKRTQATEDLLKDRNAFMLLTQIVYRARREAGIVIQNGVSTRLDVNQAFIGDYQNIGLSEGEYREAKKRLAFRKYATFKATTKGTIAMLIDKQVFDINAKSTTGNSTDK